MERSGEMNNVNKNCDSDQATDENTVEALTCTEPVSVNSEEEKKEVDKIGEIDEKDNVNAKNRDTEKVIDESPTEALPFTEPVSVNRKGEEMNELFRTAGLLKTLEDALAFYLDNIERVNRIIAKPLTCTKSVSVNPEKENGETDKIGKNDKKDNVNEKNEDTDQAIDENSVEALACTEPGSVNKEDTTIFALNKKMDKAFALYKKQTERVKRNTAKPVSVNRGKENEVLKIEMVNGSSVLKIGAERVPGIEVNGIIFTGVTYRQFLKMLGKNRRNK